MFVELPNLVIILLDILAWFLIHMSLSLMMLRIPDQWFEKQHTLFQTKAWEKGGEIWQRLFRIREWKQFLPDSTKIIKRAYDKTNLHGTNPKRLKKFITETKRAELTHWLSIPPALLFFIWNPPWAGVIMIIYALVVNLPFIIAQRYNRPRLIRLYKLKLRKQEKVYPKQKYYA